MGQVSLSMPVLNQLDSTEEPKIITDFTTLQTLVNGNIDTTNLAAAAGIVKGQLAAGAGSLGVRNVTANTSAANGDLIIVTGGTPPIVVTLPSPTIHSTVGIVAFGATTTVTASSGVIVGVGFNAGSVTLGTVASFLILEANGTNWHTIGGQADTGWVNLTLSANMAAAAGSVTPGARLIADRVYLRGEIENATGGGQLQPIATIPSGLRPTATVRFSVVQESGAAIASPPNFTADALVITTTGVISSMNGGLFPLLNVNLEGLSFGI